MSKMYIIRFTHTDTSQLFQKYFFFTQEYTCCIPIDLKKKKFNNIRHAYGSSHHWMYLIYGKIQVIFWEDLYSWYSLPPSEPIFTLLIRDRFDWLSIFRFFPKIRLSGRLIKDKLMESAIQRLLFFIINCVIRVFIQFSCISWQNINLIYFNVYTARFALSTITMGQQTF